MNAKDYQSLSLPSLIRCVIIQTQLGYVDLNALGEIEAMSPEIVSPSAVLATMDEQMGEALVHVEASEV